MCLAARAWDVLPALLAIIVAAPFERPLIVLPGVVTLTTLEIVTMIALLTIAARAGRRSWPSCAPAHVVPAVVFLLAMSIAALVAPIERGHALRFVARLGTAAVLCAVTAAVVDSRQRARAVAWTMLGVAALVAATAVLEAAEVPLVLSALTAFRPGMHVVGGQLRATSTLLYPTIASMYLEVAFAVGLWLLLDPAVPRVRARALPFAALVIVAAGITATFTRAGIFAMGAVLLLAAMLGPGRAPRAYVGLGWLTGLAAAVVAIVLLSHPPALLAARLTTEGSRAWYGAEYGVPQTLHFETGARHLVRVSVTNRGRIPWDSIGEPPFALAYHWTRGADAAVVEFEGARTPFPDVVSVGETVSFDAEVFAPGAPGDYTLVWDVVHEGRAWLSTEGVTPGRSAATVSGPPVAPVVRTMAHLPAARVVPTRPELWTAALDIAADHPRFGVGPDNFRHVYGRYLGIADWDRRVHANNLYLDVLAGAGVPGLATLLWLLAAMGGACWRRVRAAEPRARAAAISALAVWVVIAGHGVVDSFLSFTTTYVTFAVALGLGCSGGLTAASVDDDHAHRV